MKRCLTAVLSACILFGILTTCAGTQQQTGAQANASQESQDSSKKDQLYIEVSALGNLDYFYDHMMGMQKVGEELGVTTEYVGPAEYDMNAMVAAFEEAIAKKPNGIVVVGFEDTLNPIVQKALDAGIPVVTVDADLPDSGRVAFVGTGNVNAGRVGQAKLINVVSSFKIQ